MSGDPRPAAIRLIAATWLATTGLALSAAGCVVESKRWATPFGVNDNEIGLHRRYGAGLLGNDLLKFAMTRELMVAEVFY